VANWCQNSIAFTQSDGGSDLLEAFFADIQKYKDFIDPETGKRSEWIGHWFREKRINTDKLYVRGFLYECELFDDYVFVQMETAWSPLPEIWDIMAETYGLEYVYISEEAGYEVFVNTDSDGRFFTTRFTTNCFDLCDLELDAATLSEYGDRLKRVGWETRYYDSFKEVLQTFEDFEFVVTDIEGLNRSLEKFGVKVYEYKTE
jgi:hypothetical protein